jgi:hypothetical protein
MQSVSSLVRGCDVTLQEGGKKNTWLQVTAILSPVWKVLRFSYMLRAFVHSVEPTHEPIIVINKLQTGQECC